MKDASKRGMAAAKKDGTLRQVQAGTVAVDVWAEPLEKPDMDRFVAVLVTLAQRHMEQEAEKRGGRSKS